MNSSNQDCSSVYYFNFSVSFYSPYSFNTLSITDTNFIERKEINMYSSFYLCFDECPVTGDSEREVLMLTVDDDKTLETIFKSLSHREY